MVLYFTFEFRSCTVVRCTVPVSEPTQAKCVTPALNSKLKYEKLVAAVRVPENTQNFVISCYFSEDGYEMYIDL